MEQIYFLILVMSAIFFTAFSVNKDREFIEKTKDYRSLNYDTEEFIDYVIMLIANVMAILNIAIILRLAFYGAFGR